MASPPTSEKPRVAVRESAFERLREVAPAGVEVVLLDDPECVQLMSTFIAEKPEIWFEDIGQD